MRVLGIDPGADPVRSRGGRRRTRAAAARWSRSTCSAPRPSSTPPTGWSRSSAAVDDWLVAHRPDAVADRAGLRPAQRADGDGHRPGRRGGHAGRGPARHPGQRCTPRARSRRRSPAPDGPTRTRSARWSPGSSSSTRRPGRPTPPTRWRWPSVTSGAAARTARLTAAVEAAAAQAARQRPAFDGPPVRRALDDRPAQRQRHPGRPDLGRDRGRRHRPARPVQPGHRGRAAGRAADDPGHLADRPRGLAHPVRLRLASTSGSSSSCC